METPGDTSADTPLMEGANHNNSESNSNSNNDVTQPQPPDGGFWAWLVLVSCFLVNGIIFGIINTFGILFVQLKIDLDEAGVEDAATKCGNVMTSFYLSNIRYKQQDNLFWNGTTILLNPLAKVDSQKQYHFTFLLFCQL